MGDKAERRRFIRTQTQCKMTFRIPQSTETFPATCHNLSGAGVMFTSRHPPGHGVALEIRICPESKAAPPLEALVEVLRVGEKAGFYEIAAEIKGIKS